MMRSGLRVGSFPFLIASRAFSRKVLSCISKLSPSRPSRRNGARERVVSFPEVRIGESPDAADLLHQPEFDGRAGPPSVETGGKSFFKELRRCRPGKSSRTPNAT